MTDVPAKYAHLPRDRFGDSTELADELLALATPPDMETFRALAIPALIARFRRGVECFDRRVLVLADDKLDTAFLPDAPGNLGRWPCRVLLGHLADADV